MLMRPAIPVKTKRSCMRAALHSTEKLTGVPIQARATILKNFLCPKAYLPITNTNPANFPVLRYADVLLMQAEALNELGQTTQAEAPLNLVRKRSNLAEVHGLTKDAFREKVLHERRMELAFEGHWWFDIIRVNTASMRLIFCIP